MDTAWITCMKKRDNAYKSPKKARDAIRDHWPKKKYGKMWYYKCPCCQKYHLTSSDPAKWVVVEE